MTQNQPGKMPQTFNPMLRTQLPDDVISVGYREVRPYHHAQVFRSQKVEFEGTEEEFVKAGLAYQYSELDQHRRLVHGGDQQPQPRKVCETEYLFYIEGLAREVWQTGESEKAAHAVLWQSLSDDERNRVVLMECIDERQAGSEPSKA